MTDSEALAEPTRQIATRIPKSLINEARTKASFKMPGITDAGMIRFALAMLAGIPNPELYGKELPRSRYGHRKLNQKT